MGKKTVVVNEFPGFVTSRMNCLIGNEAMNMLMEALQQLRILIRRLIRIKSSNGSIGIGRFSWFGYSFEKYGISVSKLGEKYRPSPLLVKVCKGRQIGQEIRSRIL